MADSGTDRFSFDKVFAALLGRGGGGFQLKRFLLRRCEFFVFVF